MGNKWNVKQMNLTTNITAGKNHNIHSILVAEISLALLKIKDTYKILRLWLWLLRLWLLNVNYCVVILCKVTKNVINSVFNL